MSESSQNQTQVSITAKFSFPEGDTSKQEPTTVVEQTFDSSNCEPAILGLPPGVDPVKVSLSAVSCGRHMLFDTAVRSIDLIHSVHFHWKLHCNHLVKSIIPSQKVAITAILECTTMGHCLLQKKAATLPS
jgi:hypothetical protein